MDERSMVPQDNRPQMGMVAVSADQHGYVEALIRSEVQARTAVALARPRSFDNARDTLLREAARPGFAADAEWRQERWDARKGRAVEITGPSIRFAEAAKRALTNIVSSTTVIHEDDKYRIGKVSVADLETNEADSADIIVKKQMERRKPPRNADELIGTRAGADGQTIYICAAPESEILMMFNSQASRALRNLILRFVPGDLVDEALEKCRETRGKADAADPDAARRKVADAFSLNLQVRPADLEKYLRHPLAQTTPAELDGLRALYRALADGQTTWPEVMADRDAEQDDKAKPDPASRARDAVAEATRRGPGRPRKEQPVDMPPIPPRPEPPQGSPSDLCRERWMKANPMLNRDEFQRFAGWVVFGTPGDESSRAAAEARGVELWTRDLTEQEIAALDAKVAEMAQAGE